MLKNKYGDEKRWLNWFSKDGTKVPIGSSTDPATWSTYANLNHKRPVGIVFTPDRLLLGIDIDHCLIPGSTNIVHEKKELIAEVFAAADTYAEISPSKTGLHLFLALSAPLQLARNKIAPFEAYTSGRFFTVTGEAYKTPKDIRVVTPEEAVKILSLIGDGWQGEETLTPPLEDSEDDILLKKIFSSKDGARIEALYNGDISQHKNDRSSADMALVSHLAFWTGGDAVRMDRIWLRSPLSNRDKAIVRKDYRPRTIAKAIKNCKEFYKGSIKVTPAPVKSEDELIFLKTSEIKCKPINWLWEGRIAKGKVTLIAGDPGLGKSQTTIDIASVVSRGGKFPGAKQCVKGKVLLFSAEDDPADTIVPRLVATGADLSQISIFSMVKRDGKDSFFDLSKDVALLGDILRKENDISLIVVDPITAFLGDADSHVNAEVRALLHQLSKVASEFGTAVLCVTHFNKNSSGTPMNKITGSLAFVAAARAAFVVIKDENDEGRRLFLPVKNNLAEDKSGYAFRVESCNLTMDGVAIGTSKVVWEEGAIMVSVMDAMKDNENGRGVDKATVEWMESYLRTHPSGVSFDILEGEARKHGISRATIYRAEKAMFIDKVYVGKNKPKVWRMAFDHNAVDEGDVNPEDVPI